MPRPAERTNGPYLKEMHLLLSGRGKAVTFIGNVSEIKVPSEIPAGMRA